MSIDEETEQELVDFWGRPHLEGDANREADDISKTIMGLINSNPLVRFKVVEQLYRDLEQSYQDKKKLYNSEAYQREQWRQSVHGSMPIEEEENEEDE